MIAIVVPIPIVAKIPCGFSHGFGGPGAGVVGTLDTDSAVIDAISGCLWRVIGDSGLTL